MFFFSILLKQKKILKDNLTKNLTFQKQFVPLQPIFLVAEKSQVFPLGQVLDLEAKLPLLLCVAEAEGMLHPQLVLKRILAWLRLLQQKLRQQWMQGYTS